METTTHGLKKPASSDFYNVEDFNANTDIVEEHLSDTESHVNAAEIIAIAEATELAEIGTGDTNDTIWGKVKKAISVLKSHITQAATGSVLGHIKIGTGLQISSGTASVKLSDSLELNDSNTAASSKAAKLLNDNLGSKAPTSHASSETTYGVGNASNYGHVKLSDTYNTNIGSADNAIGASQSALYNVYNKLNDVLLYKPIFNTALDSIPYTYCPDIQKKYLFHGINIGGLPAELLDAYTENDVYIEIIVYNTDKSWIKYRVIDVRTDNEYTISKLNGSYTTWKKL